MVIPSYSFTKLFTLKASGGHEHIVQKEY